MPRSIDAFSASLYNRGCHALEHPLEKSAILKGSTCDYEPVCGVLRKVFTLSVWNELFDGFRNEDNAAIKLLFESGRLSVDENGPEGSPLVLASGFGNAEIVEWMIEKGADVNLKRAAGITPLMVTAEQNKPRNARVLLDHGADVHARAGNEVHSQSFRSPHHGETALHIAAAYSGEELIQMLLDAGADPNAEDALGLVPFIYFRRQRHVPRDEGTIRSLLL